MQNAQMNCYAPPFRAWGLLACAPASSLRGGCQHVPDRRGLLEGATPAPQRADSRCMLLVGIDGAACIVCTGCDPGIEDTELWIFFDTQLKAVVLLRLQPAEQYVVAVSAAIFLNRLPVYGRLCPTS